MQLSRFVFVMKKLSNNRYTLNDVLYTVPAFLIFILVLLIPLITTFIAALTKWNGVGGSMQFIGFGNFKKIFDPETSSWKALVFSFKFTVVSVIITNLIALLIALVITGRMKSPLGGALRVVYFIPNLVGGLTMGFIWRFIFLRVFSTINLPLFNALWLATPSTAYWASIIVFCWKNIGYVMLIYIANLQNIERDVLESAMLDGASYISVLFRIKLPLIVPAITSSLFLIISRAFKLFDIVFSLTGGGPYGSTISYAYEIYFEAFKRNNYGLGSAKAVVFFVIVAAVSLLQVYLTKRKEVEL